MMLMFYFVVDVCESLNYGMNSFLHQETPISGETSILPAGLRRKQVHGLMVFESSLLKLATTFGV